MPAGSLPGRDSNEKLFTMTPDTWHIQVWSLHQYRCSWLSLGGPAFHVFHVFFFFCGVTFVLLDVINAKWRTSSESCCHIPFNSPPLSPLCSYGISRHEAGARRGACRCVTAPANILIITVGLGLHAGCPCPLCGTFRGKKRRHFFSLLSILGRCRC